ncbi:MAG: hypothetical protein IPK54_12625 [Dokdonella sp.]|jgi:hypothetical protein|uniref:hypothetical protein n=1 Tax=Dokdonella sp. TaxID=2291710 RepID=UPI0025C49205|nr:hypothetical protein [Dokdonella sp.]MBK8124376.1 hypothetical protein [Dokdonella sp.]
MRLHLLLAVVLTLVLALPAFACDPAGSEVFNPSRDKAIHHSDPTTGWAAHPPAPEVVAVDVSRGTGSDGFSCADAGSVSIKLRLPESTPFQIGELGFYFRVLTGNNILAGHAVPLVTNSKRRRVGSFVIFWLDGSPAQQQPLDIVAEVFPVTHWLEIGPATRFEIRAPVGS